MISILSHIKSISVFCVLICLTCYPLRIAAQTDANAELRIQKFLQAGSQALLSNPTDGVRPVKQAQFIARNNELWEYELQADELLGDIYTRLSDFDIAVSLYSKAINIAETKKYDSKLIDLYYKLALVHAYLENTVEAFRFYELSKKAAQQINNKLMVMRALAGAAYTEIYYNKRTEKTNLHRIQAYYDSLTFQSNDHHLLASAANVLAGATYLVSKDFVRAELLYLEGIMHSNAVNDVWRVILIENNLTQMYIVSGKFDKAQKLIVKNLKLAEDLKSKLLIRNTLLLKATYHEKLGEYKAANEANKKAYNVNQLLLNEKVIRETQEAISLYRLEKAEKESELLKKTNELIELKAAAEIKFYQILSIFAFGAVLLFLIFYRQKRTQYLQIAEQAKTIEEQNKALQHLNESLISGKNELQRAKEELEKAYRTKSDFLSMVSHEVRTPLNVILGIAQHLQQEPLDANQKKNVQLLLQAGESLLFIINDLLDIGKIEAGKMELEVHTFSLRSLIENTCNAFEHRANDKGLKLITVFEPENLNLIVKADRLRLGQILNNLISNAIKFTESGFVTIQLSHIATYGDVGNFKICVQDTGIGIPKEKHSLIFQPFQQVGSSPSTRIGGTGLGLSITKKLVELMDGEITFESEANKGSKFCVNLYLPISNMQDTPYAHAEPDREILASLQGISVLIVDDLEANTLVINNFLEKWGIITDIAFTGRDAIEKAKTNKYHLILMDLHMPDMDGQTTTFELRKIEEYEDVPIIAITASALVVNKSLNEKDGINDYITKPFKAEDLLAKIVKHLVPLAKP